MHQETQPQSLGVSPGLGEACPPHGSKAPGNLMPAAQELRVPSSGPPDLPASRGPRQDCSSQRPTDPVPGSHRRPLQAVLLGAPPGPPGTVSVQFRLSQRSSPDYPGVGFHQQNPQEEELRSQLVTGRAVGKRCASNTPRLTCSVDQARRSPQDAGGRVPPVPWTILCAVLTRDSATLSTQLLPAALPG